MSNKDSQDRDSACFFIGFLFGAVLAGAAMMFAGLIAYDGIKSQAVKKGAAIYRIKPGTLSEVEFVWKSDMENEK